MPGDSTVNQLTYLYNKFCKALDEGLEIRIVFFDISKAFDKVWHKGLIFKLEKAGIQGKLLKWFHNYLCDRKQRVVIRGATSGSMGTSAGVPQGSILGPLLFLIFINDIVTDIDCPINLFADDTSLYVIVNDPIDSAVKLQSDINKIDSWASKWIVNFNPSKSETLLMTRKRNEVDHPDLNMSGIKINPVMNHKHLGLVFSNDASWHDHICIVKEKAWSRINILRALKYKLDRKTLEIIYFSFVRPLLEYADVVWDNCTQNEKNELEKIQYEAARIVTGCTKLVSIESLMSEVGWRPLSDRRKIHKLVMFFKMVNHLLPDYLSDLVPIPETTYNLRNANDIPRIHARTVQYYDSYLPSSIRGWNALDADIRGSNFQEFRTKISSYDVHTKKLFLYGPRSIQITHTRIRTKCSNLKEHLFRKNIIDSPLCIYCNVSETNYHYFFKCTKYHEARNRLLLRITNITRPSINVLLNGDDELPLDRNLEILDAVFNYIIETKRFKKYIAN